MNTTSATVNVPAAVLELFDAKPPVLVEVRFLRMGTPSDWFLCDDEREFSTVLDRLGIGVEIHLRSVWDLAGIAEVIWKR